MRMYDIGIHTCIFLLNTQLLPHVLLGSNRYQSYEPSVSRYLLGE
nr:MAG TPA: hypothetical protein [Caudoviricetes sp.]